MEFYTGSGSGPAGSFANFVSQYGVTDANLSNFVGAYGASDPASGDYTVWAIVDHASTFAAVPEPAQLGLVSLLFLGLIVLPRRSRRTIANG
jgi:hypothetical protein